MSVRDEATSTAVYNLRQAGVKFVDIAVKLGKTYKSVQQAYYREAERRAPPKREPMAETRKRLREAAAAKALPGYHPSVVQPMYRSAVMRPYSPPLALRLAAAKAAACQPAFLSMGSRIPEVQEGTQWPA